MPIHTPAERKKRKKQIRDLFQNIIPGQLSRNILGKVNKKLKDVGKKKK